jgi:DNA-binding CsgD family transcriptional regulator
MLATTIETLAAPGLVVLTGGPGAGRSTLLARVGAAFRGPVFAGGGLSMLRTVPALALARAVKARLPGHDLALLSEAVRSRVRGGLLLIDDLQWADPASLGALPAIAAHCRVVVTLRTPTRLDVDALRKVAAGWLPVPALTGEEAFALARQAAPGLPEATVARVVRRAGGVPLAVESLARHAAAGADDDQETDPLAYAVAGALADLSRAGRTAMAALGLLGRPAAAPLLGTGLAVLVEAGLVRIEEGLAIPVSPYVAEVAAGLLPVPERRALHQRLADLVPPREAVRHLAAAGQPQAAHDRAVAAALAATTLGDRAELYALACELPGVTIPAGVRRAAATVTLSAGLPQTCLRILDASAAGTEPAVAVLRGEALLQLGDVPAALAAIADLPDGDGPDPATRTTRDRLRLLALLSTDPAAALTEADTAESRHASAPTGQAGLRAAIAAVRAAHRTAGWESGLAAAAASAGTSGDLLSARWSGWLLVETLAADGRLTEAARAAAAAAAACAVDLAYSWQTRFLAARLWCLAMAGQHIDDVVAQAGELSDRTLPALALGYVTAAASLGEADGGLLASARARLRRLPALPPAMTALLDWVDREAAWLDGQPDKANAAPVAGPTVAPLVDGLRRITARWAAYDAGLPPPAGDRGGPPPVRATLEAWAGDDPGRFDQAAAAWHDLAAREEVRCLLAHGLRAADPAEAVPPLLAAEALAEATGLVVLLGRTRRALRRHSIRRDIRGPRSGNELTDRERDVLRLVAHGEPTRRIALQLGISRETVETHIRSGMRKLGARTRTEAAALALEVLG